MIKTNMYTPVNIPQDVCCLPPLQEKTDVVRIQAISPHMLFQQDDFEYENRYYDRPGDINEIVAEINKFKLHRVRFGQLRETKDCIVSALQYDDFKTRIRINASTQEDAVAAMFYLNHCIEQALYPLIDYTRCYRLHKQWLTKDNQVIDTPNWYKDSYPMYIDTKDRDCEAILNDSALLDKFELIYILDYAAQPEDKIECQLPGGMQINISKTASREPANIRKSLLRSEFITINIPAPDSAQLCAAFNEVINDMCMSVSSGFCFDNVLGNYADIITSEYEVYSAAQMIKTYKRLNNSMDKPISEKDFSAVFNAGISAYEKKTAVSKRKKRIRQTDNPWDELNNLVGIDSVKEELHKLIDCLKLDKIRRDSGLPPLNKTGHSLFFGSPGTAKTTVARTFASILEYEKLLNGNAYRELNKSDVVGAYVGQTAEKVDKLFNEASEAGGGVLFFDEAYTYTEIDSTCYDKEAINCIVQHLDNHRDVICIFAGYKEKMQNFAEANSGLRSRIGFVLEFSDYDADTMCDIAEHEAGKIGYEMPDGCRDMLKDYFTQLKEIQGDNWGNGREARKIIENAVAEIAKHISGCDGKYKQSHLTKLSISDIENAISNSLARERGFAAGEIERKPIGF